MRWPRGPHQDILSLKYLAALRFGRAVAMDIVCVGGGPAFETEVDALDAYGCADLIVAADGINSRIRGRYADSFEPDIDVRPNKFIWLGTGRPFDAFTFIFLETPQGWIWAHAYRFEA